MARKGHHPSSSDLIVSSAKVFLLSDAPRAAIGLALCHDDAGVVQEAVEQADGGRLLGEEVPPVLEGRQGWFEGADRGARTSLPGAELLRGQATRSRLEL
jgi:hypothetical protein